MICCIRLEAVSVLEEEEEEELLLPVLLVRVGVEEEGGETVGFPDTGSTVGGEWVLGGAILWGK